MLRSILRFNLTVCRIQFSRMKVQNCRERLSKIFDQNKVDHTHGIEHAMIVTNHGSKVIQTYNLNENQQQEIILACLLHDADDKKYFPQNKSYDNARQILASIAMNEQRIEKIIQMISLVSFSKNGDTIDPNKEQFWYYPRYCDRVDAIGYNGLVRAYEYAKHVKNPIKCEHTQRPKNVEQLKRVCFGRNDEYIKRGGTSQSFIDHIFDKLVHLSLPSYITNPYLIQKYKQGYSQIVSFVLRHSGNNYEDVENQLQNVIKSRSS